MNVSNLQFSLLYITLLLISSSALLNAEELNLMDKSIKLWKQAGPGQMLIDKNEATTKGGMGLWWYSGKEFQDFTLSLEFKLGSANDNSGIFLNFPDPGKDPWVAVKQGYEVQIQGSETTTKQTGAIYDKQAPRSNPIKMDDWNHYEITQLNGYCIVRLNSEFINVFKIEHNHKSGYIGIQNHDDDSKIKFRNISVKEHPFAQPVFSAKERAEIRECKNPNAPWWEIMDFGPFNTGVIKDEGNKTYTVKGIAIEVGNEMAPFNMVFDTEFLRIASVGKGKIKLHGTPYDGHHGGSILQNHPITSTLQTQVWSTNENFEDPREIPYGPIPDDLGKYNGLYRHGRKIILSYDVRSTKVLESPDHESFEGVEALSRSFSIAERKEKLLLTIADLFTYQKMSINADKDIASIKSDTGDFQIAVTGDSGIKFKRKNEKLFAEISRGKAIKFKLLFTTNKEKITAKTLSNWPKAVDLAIFCKGGPSQYNEEITLSGEIAENSDPYVVDTIPVPSENPWASKMKIGDFDFFNDGETAAACTWNGDVWIISNIDEKLDKVSWKRFATGMYEPLGLKIVDDIVYVSCRDQITRLHDLNGDNEADFYENFNNDVMITNNFHEFHFGLETDKEGNFYFAKGASVRQGGRGFEDLTPHNGTMLKLSPDGKKLEVYSTGLRAPGGIGVSPDGQVTAGDNEGTWVPQCKLHWLKPGSFQGVKSTAHPGQNTDTYNKPLCWFPMDIDNSSGSQVWVEPDSWGPFTGDMLHLSYGKSAIYKVLQEEVNGQIQGGVFKLPVTLQSSAQRAAFNSKDEHLYVSGFKGWQTNAATECAFHRIRYTGKKVHMPKNLFANKEGVLIEFTSELDKVTAEDPLSYNIEWWNYSWGPRYGSGHYSVNNPDPEMQKRTELLNNERRSSGIRSYKKHDDIPVEYAVLLDDKKTVFLKIKDMKEVMQMQIDLNIKSADQTPIKTSIYNTINTLEGSTDKVKGIKAPSSYDPNKIRIKPGTDKGLKLKLTDSQGNSDVQNARLLALITENGNAPSPFLKDSKYTAEWSGIITLKERTEVLFSSDILGIAELKINDQIVYNSSNKSKEKVTLEKGSHNFYCKYTTDSSEKSRFRLYWQSDNFTKEPLSPELFTFTPDHEYTKARFLNMGRQVFAEQRCAACHDTGVENLMPELDRDSPSFKNIGNRLNKNWMANWIVRPREIKRQASMPGLFGYHNHWQAAKENDERPWDIAAYLASLKSGEEYPESESSETLIKAGGDHFHKLGCISCHFRPESRYNRGLEGLNHVKQKFTSKPALAAFLKEPEKHYKWTQMPNFQLSDKEAEELAAYLFANARHQDYEGPEPMKGDPVKGKALVKEMNCLNCHDPENAEDLKLGFPSKEYNGKGHDFNMTDDERYALGQFLQYGAEPLTKHIPTQFAHRQIKELNCTACHTQDGEIDKLSLRHNKTSDLALDEGNHFDQSRPLLTWMGEKLKHEYLHDMLSGEEGSRARPWLDTRMPAFKTRATKLADGMAAMHGMPKEDEKSSHTPEKIKTGESLVGTTGFSCVICHEVGDIKAIAAFEAMGVNLKHSAERLRYDYYNRWMMDPLRIAPNSKMPRFGVNGKTAFSHIYDGDAEEQYKAIWYYLENLNN